MPPKTTNDEIKYAWVTCAEDEKSCIQAAALGRSLTRVLTIADTIAVVPDNLEKKFWYLLRDCFDKVLTLDASEIETMQSVENVSALDIMKVFAFNMEMYKKIGVLSPNNLILENCDELFELKKRYYVPDPSPRDQSRLPPIFIIKPKRKNFDRIFERKLSREFRLWEIFTGYCGIFHKTNMGKLSGKYNLHIADIKTTNTRLLKNLKVISHAFRTEILKNDNPATQEIKDFWNSCWVETHNFLQQEFEEVTPEKPAAVPEKPLRNYKDAIAIVGHSCRFPDANGNEEFWKFLTSGEEANRGIPSERLKLLQLDEEAFKNFKGTFLKTPIEEFDANFFGVNPQEAVLMDVRERLLLEVGWEALEDAGIDPHSLKGGNTAVFSALCKSDYKNIAKENAESEAVDGVVTGDPFSNILGLKGANVCTESGCSITALHSACESLRKKETDLAVVTGINLLMANFEVLARYSECEAFDGEGGGGSWPAEGVAVLLLKRFPEAVAHGDRVLGIIRASVLTDQKSAPSKVIRQKKAIREALKRSGVKAEEVDYVEASGTATSVDNPIELAALAKGYAAKREHPMIIGSTKASIGCTGAAAGLAAVIKVILSMKNEIIPQFADIPAMNANPQLDKLPAVLPVGNQGWKREQGRNRLAGFSSSGMDTTDVHVLIEEPPTEDKFARMKINCLEAERTHHILNLSAKTETALNALIDSYVDYLERNPEIDVRDLTFSTNKGRAHFKCRASVVGKDVSQLRTALGNKSPTPPVPKGSLKIAFLFTGQGCQYSGMGQDLYTSNSIFRDAFDECAAIVEKKVEIRLKDVLWKAEGLVEDHVVRQLSIFSVQYSLVTLFIQLGIAPDFVLGHSDGEYVAAVASGIMQLATALDLLIKKSKLIAKLPGGATGDIENILETFSKSTSAIKYKNPACKYISGTTGSLLGMDEMAGGSYWLTHAKESVNFTKGVANLIENKNNIFIEIGPCSVVSGLEMTKANSVENTLWLATLEENKNVWEIFLNSLAKLYINGVDINWDLIEGAGNRNKLELPIYPFQRKKYWIKQSEKEVKPLLRKDKEVLPLVGKDKEVQPLLRKDKEVQPILRKGKEVQPRLGKGKEVLTHLGRDKEVQPLLGKDKEDQHLLRKEEEVPTPLEINKGVKPLLGKYKDLQSFVGKDIVFQHVLEKAKEVQPHLQKDKEDILLLGKGKEVQSVVGKDKEVQPVLGKDKEVPPHLGKDKEVHPLLGKQMSLDATKEIKYSKQLNSKDFEYLYDHRVGNTAIMPAAGFLEIVLAVGKDLLMKGATNCALKVSKFLIQAALEFQDGIPNEMKVTASPEEDSSVSVTTNAFSVGHGWKKHSSGSVALHREKSDIFKENLKSIKSRLTKEQSGINFYEKFNLGGHKLAKGMKSMERLWSSADGLEYLVSIPVDSLDIDNYLVHPVVLDAMFQSFVFTIETTGESIYLVIGIDSCFYFGGKMSNVLYAHCVKPRNSCGKVVLYNEDNDVIFVMSGINLIRSTFSSLMNIIRAQRNKLSR